MFCSYTVVFNYVFSCQITCSGKHEYKFSGQDA